MKTTMKCLMAVIVLLLVSSTASVAMDWTRIYEGVEYATATKTSPRPMKAYALRISLKNPDVSFFATPSNGGGALETWAQTTPAFRSAYGLEAAIDANLSTPGVSSGDPSDVEGVLVSNGSYVSYDQLYRQAQLRLTADKAASMVGTGGNPSGFHTIVSGDAHHLVGGVALGANDIARARTSVGLSQDGKYLIMCVVDEYQWGVSEGATILDMSYWMLDFGAWNAMNLDGGGSSCICTASGGVLNHPSDGSPRPVGANLGVNTTSTNYCGVDSCSWDSGRIDAVVRGNLNHVWKIDWTSANGWKWFDLGGTTMQSPAICSWGTNRLDIFCTHSTNGSTYQKTWTGSQWIDWHAFGGGNACSGPAAVTWGTNRIDVFVRNINNNAIYRSYTTNGGSTWTNYASLPTASAMCNPAACSWGTPTNGRLEVFCTHATNRYIYESHSINGGAFSSWQAVGNGTFNSSPAACSWGPNRIDLVGRHDANNLIYHAAWDGTSWSSWGSLGALPDDCVAAGDPGISSRGTGLLDVFVRGTNDHLYIKSWQNNGWTGWSDLGPCFN